MIDPYSGSILEGGARPNRSGSTARVSRLGSTAASHCSVTLVPTGSSVLARSILWGCNAQ